MEKAFQEIIDELCQETPPTSYQYMGYKYTTIDRIAILQLYLFPFLARLIWEWNYLELDSQIELYFVENIATNTYIKAALCNYNLEGCPTGYLGSIINTRENWQDFRIDFLSRLQARDS